MKQTVRIIGGQFRGKKLSFPAIEGLRPTPDRVKETLFNWLMNDIRGARCLDAFAGSGALGFEAFSRGASRVVLVEASKKAYSNLQTIASSFNSPVITVINADAEYYLKHCKEVFDIIFLDPPFAKNYQLQCLDILAHSNLLPPGGLVYLESPDKLPIDPVHWQEEKLKQAGQVTYGLYKKN
ncbi:16S rRNA (guanine(966)-N(2))-methyltransferase RsmD [Legionella jordanis]|uniref:Ribosomal RNA small subunit methyltransferase D n=1 Tax=Legionella jordanis TaxID=456 RepID=A0A0W0VBP4_9GAMM|nr:16S rRNA (guanine(966)-N(2))-methyltransferase RsmD [Legionella jordanis]KTD17512.1 methyltransferase [Legionella jordanis]RMX05150.1 16S rRNA (guanine(966)-N(2))-methyltransferase RsmD [Legionella jordanis]RMX17406.1 16S rRNA (guanine(966)-N(2))-methyltransferase RsmD [Legionella jordanis]VEH13481.1 methyltransferase [Legionella jordanis]HAT8714398.1 16S rRNA (guanine(966)-N(2))-methyltransferase RsmD [Legionella jordanis]